jgi:hypothetical protein
MNDETFSATLVDPGFNSRLKEPLSAIPPSVLVLGLSLLGFVNRLRFTVDQLPFVSFDRDIFTTGRAPGLGTL